MTPAAVPPAVYRLGRRPDPWAWPDWRYAGLDGTFGNRFDDPQGVYRVLYASTRRLATFIECLAYFRPDPAVLAEYDTIEDCDDDPAPPAAGEVPAEWLAVRCIGTGVLHGEYVDLGHHGTIAELRGALIGRLVHYGVGDLDAAAIRLTTPRALTQEISRHVFDDSEAGSRRWNGISYLSRYGDDLRNWAIFEPAAPSVSDVSNIDPRDEDLARALELHGLHLT